MVNLRENISAITLKSGKQVKNGHPKADNPSLPPIIKIVTTPPAFPSRLASTKKDDQDKEVLNTFRKVQVNIPLLDATSSQVCKIFEGTMHKEEKDERE